MSGNPSPPTFYNKIQNISHGVGGCRGEGGPGHISCTWCALSVLRCRTDGRGLLRGPWLFHRTRTPALHKRKRRVRNRIGVHGLTNTSANPMPQDGPQFGSARGCPAGGSHVGVMYPSCMPHTCLMYASSMPHLPPPPRVWKALFLADPRAPPTNACFVSKIMYYTGPTKQELARQHP